MASSRAPVVSSYTIAEDLDLAELEITLEQKGELERFEATYREMFEQEWDASKDRFPLQVHLEPSDISEVTSKRVLAKNAAALDTLRDLYGKHSGRLTANTRLTADIQLPELSTDRFQDLYPLLPYQIDLIIQVVSGLRTQGGATKHVGGANRTITSSGHDERSTTSTPPASATIPFLRSELSACPQHLKAAVQQMMELIEGNRLVTINVGDFSAECVETPEQLEAAISALRQRIEKLLGEGKKVWIQ